MEIIETIRSRRSIRGFKATPIPRTILKELLELCRWAPSYRNMQSWEFAIVGGKVLDELKARVKDKVKANVPIHPELPALDLPQPYLKRATDLRDKLDRQQFPPGTEQLAEKRAEYLVKGGRFHNAPNVLIMYAEKAVLPWAVCDAGIMAQTISLAAHAYGLGTCIMARPTYWPEIIREVIKIPESKVLLMAVAIGYPDPDAAINSCEREREPLEAFVQWYGV